MGCSFAVVFRVAALCAATLPALSVGAQSFAGNERGGATSALARAGVSGRNVNARVGADRFYEAGYTGTRAVVANIEGGHIWNKHESLTQVTTFLDARAAYDALGFPRGHLGEFDRHATWVGQTLAGRPARPGTDNFARGIAYGAALWSGAFADEWVPVSGNSAAYRTGFGYSYVGLIDPYVKAMGGVGGRRADVVNSSYTNRTEKTGSSVETLIVDGLIRQNRTIAVFSAGNEGGPRNTVGAPASGYNGISVGSTGGGLDPNYDAVSSFSSRGPNDYAQPNANGTYSLIPGVRAEVDIVAPGDNIYMAQYTGVSGGNIGGTDTNPGSVTEYRGASGTSFSAPVVAGGATLLADVAHDRFANDIDNAIDGEVIKAVLLNSADKLNGWDNGQTLDGGVVRTKQALDFAQGAGQMNLDRAFDQYTAGVADVPGMVGGTGLSSLGWDYGVVTDSRLTNDYYFAEPLLAGTTFTATLNWFVDRTFTQTGEVFDVSDNSFLNLDLQLWRVRDGSPFQLVMESDADYINTEHFSSALPATDDYLLRVSWNGARYNFTNDTSQTYGLAWSGTVAPAAAAPEPATIGYWVLGIGCWALGRKRIRIRPKA